MRPLRLPAAAAGLSAVLIPLVVLRTAGEQEFMPPPLVHVVVVALTALATTAAALLVSRAGLRRRDPRTLLAGAAFSTMSALLAVHGLTTPGVLVGPNPLTAFTGGASVVTGAAVLALARLPALRDPARLRPLLVIQLTLPALVAAVTVVGLLRPGLLPAAPAEGSPIALVVLAAGLVLYATVLLRAVRTYRLARRGGDLVIVVGVAWLALSLVAALTQGPYELGFYLGHLLELLGIIVVGAALVADLRRSAPSHALVGDLRAVELVRSAEAFLGAEMGGLLARLAEKDTSTEAHSRRVALLAVQVGEALGLPPHRLRTLALGSLLHDVGKLGVPDPILKKPAALSDDEYAVIRTHPAVGRELLEHVGRYAPAVLRLVLDHHERLDGTGYPRGLDADDLDLETRILAVCDVHDALVSDRVYRPAWSTTRALDLLRRESGTAFDATAVAGLERVLHAEQAPRSLAA